jgi:hypothetical protein
MSEFFKRAAYFVLGTKNWVTVSFCLPEDPAFSTRGRPILECKKLFFRVPVNLIKTVFYKGLDIKTVLAFVIS